MDRVEVGDRKCPGLRLRFERSGKPVFRWKAPVREGRRVITIGPWSKTEEPGYVTLKQARKWVRRLKAASERGEFGAVVHQLEATLEAGRPPKNKPQDPSPSVLAVAEQFYRKRILPKRAKPEIVRRVLDKDILPSIGSRPIADVTELELARIVDRVTERGARAYAGAVLATIKQLFRWAQGRGHFYVGGVHRVSPAFGLEAGSFDIRRTKRTRTASDDEIRALWHALDSTPEGARPLDSVTRLALKVLLLTGLRTRELRLARWADVSWNDATLTVPVSSQKIRLTERDAAKPWVVPLAPAVIDLLKSLERLRPGSPWMLASPSSKNAPIAAGTLPRAMQSVARRLPADRNTDASHLRPHDLRRTLRSGLPRIGVSRETAERCLNHALPDMEAVYNQFDYLPQRRAALDAWAAHVLSLVR